MKRAAFAAAAVAAFLATGAAGAEPPPGATPAGGVTSAGARGADPARDAIGEALATAGLTRADLGWRAQGWWDRYPQDVPYKLRHVDDLCANPLATVPWLQAMGAIVRSHLSAEGLASKGSQGAGRLFGLVHELGVHRRYGATRAYSANVTGAPTPLADALLACFAATGRRAQPVSFGKPADEPTPAGDLKAAAGTVPEDVGRVVGKLIVDLLDARRWVELAWRRVPHETREKVFEKLDLGWEETDALDYEPAVDDAARAWDEASMWTGGLKVVEALDLARLELAKLAPAAAWATAHLDVETPVGRVIVTGSGDDAVDVGERGAFLIVDLGGNDTWKGCVGASTVARGVGAMLEMGGDDVYEGGDRAQGAGVAGVGVLLDAGGKDVYRLSGTLGQGAGQFGLGVLADLSGDDEYRAAYSAQGCAFFGVGMLLDAAGADRYVLWSDGQGFGGAGGVGVLADRAGNDGYEAVVDAKTTRRPSAHTELKVTTSNAQGCGMGRRGDGSDGHSWAGGVGCLLDAEGDDEYVAANWCQGCGYWFGTGLLWDGAGNDVFRANGWASGSGAHFAIGALVDESGNDVHAVAQNWGPGYGHDFTVGICCDLAGNDRYEAGAAGLGWSINRSVALLLDGGGDDVYSFSTKDLRPGTAVFDARFLDRSGATALYWTESTSVGLFLDLGGHDTYPSGFSDGASASDPPDSPNRRSRNFGIAVDAPSGSLDFSLR